MMYHERLSLKSLKNILCLRDYAQAIFPSILDMTVFLCELQLIITVCNNAEITYCIYPHAQVNLVAAQKLQNIQCIKEK